MKTIIAGGRDFNDKNRLYSVVKQYTITEVVCGGARGADECGKLWAYDKGIPVKMFPADWNKHGRAAGHIRNKQMAEYAEQLIAFWDGKSKGTQNMINTATKLGLNVVVFRYESQESE